MTVSFSKAENQNTCTQIRDSGAERPKEQLLHLRWLLESK